MNESEVPLVELTDLDPVEAVHTRQIEVEVHKCRNELWRIRGNLRDVRGRDLPLRTGEIRRAGAALHDMSVQLVVDASLTILVAEAHTAAAPLTGICEGITPDYARLAGVRIGAGFRRDLGRLFGGIGGCTHVTELIASMASVAVQTVGSDTEKAADEKPRKLDGCHALDTTGAAVAQFYPSWYRGSP